MYIAVYRGIPVPQYSSHFLLYVIQIVGLATNNQGPVNVAFFELSMNYLCRINKDYPLLVVVASNK